MRHSKVRVSVDTGDGLGGRGPSLLTLAVVGVLVACRAPPVLPSRGDIDRIVVNGYAPTAVKPSHVIDAPTAIDKVFTVMGAHDRAWSRSLGPFPATRCTVYFFHGTEFVAMIVLGAGWIGGRRGGEVSSDDRIQNVSRPELDEIEDVVGVSRGACSKW